MPAYTNKFQLLIGGKDATKNVPFPIKWNDLLDERLDEARISIKQVNTRTFAPLTDVYLKAEDSFGNVIERYYLVSNDFSYESPPGSGKYDHEIVLIEQTKYLEGFLCDTMTFTNCLFQSDKITPIQVQPIKEGSGVFAARPEETYKTPLAANQKFTFKKFKDVVYVTVYSDKLTYSIYENNTLIHEETIEGSYNSGENGSDFVYKLKPATYKAVYSWNYNNSGLKGEGSYTFEFATIDFNSPPKWTIKTVIERVLEIVETRRQGDSQKFTLDPALHKKLDTILAPEFAFTSNTLKEVLDQIGGFIHAIPRLKGSVITFDFLGGTEMSNAADYLYNYDAFTRDIEDYATKIDSRVDNLVTSNDTEQSVVVDPYNDGYRTVRTEDVYARIEESNMIIETKYPIYEIKSLKCGIIPNKDYSGGDLTPFVFEKSEYSRMSSVGKLFPVSKSYALYYTQGERNIKGLNYKAPNATNEALEEYSIINILKETSGHDDLNIDGFFYVLAFQVSYIPIYSARVEQTKSCITNFVKPRTLAYNQGANLVETRYYGENLKGVIARMGNTERTRTFIGKKLSSIPKVGQLFDEDYYITLVAVEFCPFNYKCTLGLSMDFNRLSRYIGINSEKRYYEVSEKSACERDINYTDYLVVGEAEETEDTLFSGSQDGLDFLLDTFLQRYYLHSVSFVRAQGETKEGNSLSAMNFPVVSSSFGNSAVFTFEFEDNFGAGYQSILTKSGFYMQNVGYCDSYGRIEKLHIEYGMRINPPANISEQTQIGAYFPSVEDYTNIELLDTSFLSTETRPFIIKKDSREKLLISYQIEFVSNKPSIIIGSALTRLCPFVGGTKKGHAAKLYVLPKRISKFADVIDLTGATLILNYEGTNKCSISDGRIVFDPVITLVDGKSWVIVDGATNELLIGENVVIEAGGLIMLPVMTPRHNIYNI